MITLRVALLALALGLLIQSSRVMNDMIPDTRQEPEQRTVQHYRSDAR